MPVPRRSAGGQRQSASESCQTPAYEQGLAYKQAGVYMQAIECFTRAAADADQAVRAATQAAVCLSAVGRHEEAARSLEALLQTGQGTASDLRHSRYFLGRVLESLGRPREALAHYQIVCAGGAGFRDVESRVKRLASARSLFSSLRSFGPQDWIKGVARNCAQLLRSSG
jgi:tetratricopeptide (TPR) repeat protein